MEKAAFVAEDTEPSEVIDTLTRAIAILKREMAKSGTQILLQLKNANSVIQALSAIVQASMLSSADGERLTALVQSSQVSQDGDEDVGEPDAAVYKCHRAQDGDSEPSQLPDAEAIPRGRDQIRQRGHGRGKEGYRRKCREAGCGKWRPRGDIKGSGGRHRDACRFASELLDQSAGL